MSRILLVEHEYEWLEFKNDVKAAELFCCFFVDSFVFKPYNYSIN